MTSLTLILSIISGTIWILAIRFKMMEIRLLERAVLRHRFWVMSRDERTKKCTHHHRATTYRILPNEYDERREEITIHEN